MDGLWISLGKGTGNEDGKGKARKSDGVDKFGERQEREEKGEDDGKKDGERENCRCRQF